MMLFNVNSSENKEGRGKALGFLKENSYDIVRLFVNQIGINLFALVLYTALNVFENKDTALGVRIAMSVFATGFYLVLLYTAAWEYGAKDRIRVDSGRYAHKPGKGALMSLIANIPNLLLAVPAVIFMIIHMTAGNEVLYSAFVVLNTLIRFTSSMYLGILQGAFIAFEASTNLYFLLQTVGYAIVPAFAILSTHIGYSLGMKELRISALLFKSNSKK